MHGSTVCKTRIRFLKIAEAAHECLQNSPYRALREVRCECDQGVLFLRGNLCSFYYKQLAQEAVIKLRGVSQVINEIEVG